MKEKEWRKRRRKGELSKELGRLQMVDCRKKLVLLLHLVASKFLVFDTLSGF